MIEFYDVSLWQNPSNVQKLVRENNDIALAVKVSEGQKITDPKCKAHVDNTKDKVKCYILYHYLRPDASNDFRVEMENFLNSAKKTRLKSAVLALDFERPNANSSNPVHVEYLKNCISYIESKKGHAPYVYINESECKTLLKMYSPAWLWVAKWSMFKPSIPCGIWQYTNTHGVIDRNRFLGESLAQLERHKVNL